MPFKYFLCEGNLSWLIRLFHCGITLGVIGSLLFTNSVLHDIFFNRKDILYGCAFLILNLISLILYIIVSYMDPGYVIKKVNPVDNQQERSSSDESELDSSGIDVSPLIKKNSRKQSPTNGSPAINNRHCSICGIKQPLRCRHCNDCQKCVLKYDHHCPWIDNCIGEYNHPMFFTFLIFQLAALLWTIYWSWISVSSYSQWSMWVYNNIFFILNIIICLFGGVPLICLLIFHFYLALTNSTTWETAAREKITYLKKLGLSFNPFHQGYCKNLMQFCCRYDYPKRWEVVYRKNCQKLSELDLNDVETGNGIRVTLDNRNKHLDDL